MKNNKKNSGIIFAENNRKDWGGLSAVLVDGQSINSKSFVVENKTGLVLSYWFEGAIKSAYKLGSDKWLNQNSLKDSFMIAGAHEMAQWRWRIMGKEDPSLAMLLNIEQTLIDSIAVEAGIDRQSVDFHHLTNQRDPLISHIFKRLLVELKSDDPLSKFSTDILKQELVVHLLRKYTVHSKKVGSIAKGLSEKQLFLVNDYIESCYDQEIKLKDLAGLVNLSEYHFLRLYKRSRNITPYQYILQCRFNRAQVLLSSTFLTVQQIAFQIGYKDASAFNKAFNKYAGISPSTYRKQCLP